MSDSVSGIWASARRWRHFDAGVSSKEVRETGGQKKQGKKEKKKMKVTVKV